MQGETSRVGHQGMRIPMSSSSYENTVPLYPVSSYFGGDMEVFKPSEQEQRMLDSRSSSLRGQDPQNALLSYMEVAKKAQDLRVENNRLNMMYSQLEKAYSDLANEAQALRVENNKLKWTCSQLTAAGHSGLGSGLGTGHEVDSMLTTQGMPKTELCKHWLTGPCPFGGSCDFAHGMQEKRPIDRHPRYKNKTCHSVGSGAACRYGSRCHFRH